MKTFLFTLMMLVGQSYANSETISKAIMQEWTRFRQMVESVEPQGDVGGYMQYRDYDNMTLLWRVSDDNGENEEIRFFMYRDNGDVFAVTYHKTKAIVPGKMVLRRFVGTEPTGWINHTVDYSTGEYLGTQGFEIPLTKAEKKMMSDFGISKLNKKDK